MILDTKQFIKKHLYCQYWKITKGEPPITVLQIPSMESIATDNVQLYD